MAKTSKKNTFAKPPTPRKKRGGKNMAQPKPRIPDVKPRKGFAIARVLVAVAASGRTGTYDLPMGADIDNGVCELLCGFSAEDQADIQFYVSDITVPLPKRAVIKKAKARTQPVATPEATQTPAATARTRLPFALYDDDPDPPETESTATIDDRA